MQHGTEEVQPRQQESSWSVRQLLWSEGKVDQKKRRTGPCWSGLVACSSLSLSHLFVSCGSLVLFMSGVQFQGHSLQKSLRHSHRWAIIQESVWRKRYILLWLYVSSTSSEWNLWGTALHSICASCNSCRCCSRKVHSCAICWTYQF